MTIPLAALLFFAAWTLATLALTVGIHRWSRILSGAARIDEFPAHAPVGPDWYRRATRAHLNCVENLPVFASIVLVGWALGARGQVFDLLALAVACARVGQTLTHVAFPETARSVSIRFTFFSVQLLAMLAMIVVLVSRGSPS